MATQVNGVDPSELRPVAFVDFDGVIVHDSTNTLIDGAEGALRKLAESHRIILFTSRHPSMFGAVTALDIPIEGYIPKPMACNYLYVDDRLQVENCATSLSDCMKHSLSPRNTGPWR